MRRIRGRPCSTCQVMCFEFMFLWPIVQSEVRRVLALFYVFVLLSLEVSSVSDCSRDASKTQRRGDIET